MSSVIKSVSFDAIDALILARFWAAAQGSDVDEADSTTPGVGSPSEPRMPQPGGRAIAKAFGSGEFRVVRTMTVPVATAAAAAKAGAGAVAWGRHWAFRVASLRFTSVCRVAR